LEKCIFSKIASQISKLPMGEGVCTCFEVLIIVTRFVKRGLPHTSNFIDLKDCNLVLINGMNLKFSHNVLQCFSLF